MMNYRRFFTRSLTALCALGVALAAVGCEEDLSVTDEPVMNARVDGNTWSAGDNVDATVFSTLKTITGTAGDGSSITLNLSKVTATGTLEIDGGNISAAYSIGSKAYTAVDGTVVVTELDEQNNISGTFDFSGKTGTGEEVNVENGSFSATLR